MECVGLNVQDKKRYEGGCGENVMMTGGNRLRTIAGQRSYNWQIENRKKCYEL